MDIHETSRGRSRRRRARLGLLLALPAVACPLPAAAQGPLEKAAAPIEIELKPSPVAIGGTFVISGKTLLLEGHRTVAIAVHPPAGQPDKLVADVDANGEFTVSYKVPAAGQYRVVATSPDGKATAEAEVSALPSIGVSEQSTKAVQQLVAEMKEGVANLRDQVAQQPPSPPQQELLEMLDELEHGLEQAPAVELRKGMMALDKLVQQHPEAMAELQPAYDALAEAAETVDEMTPELRRRLRDLSVENQLCDHISAAGEGLAFASLVLDVLLGKGISRLVNVLFDKSLPQRVTSSVPALANDPNAKFVVDETIKLAYAGTQGFVSSAQGVAGYLNDVAQLATESTFAAYCEKYEGPMKALFHLEYFEQGERWYAYDVALEGRLVLRYRKGAASSQGIPVSGEFEGAASKFTVWENLPVLQPAVRRYVADRKAWPAIAVPPPPGEVGLVGRLGTSKLGLTHYFNIPVAGLLKGDQLALKFEKAKADYEAKATVVYILMEPMLPIPEVYVGRFPYRDAEYILTRATHREPVFKVVADKANNVTRLKRTFEREEQRAGSWLVRFKLDVEACNPSCP